MKDQFVTYEIAIKIKEAGMAQDKGPDSPFFGFYRKKPKDYLEDVKDEYILIAQNPFYFKIDEICVAPLWQQAIDWLREKHQIFIDLETDCTSYPKYCFSINVFTGNPKDLTERAWGWEQVKNMQWVLYREYQQARETAILKALELIK